MSDFEKLLNELYPNNTKDRITSFGLKNFRVFKEYQNFQLRPFTILTGTNNSGKSSVTKALLLVKENEKEINQDSCSSVFFNYFNGEHNLGNHQFIKNKKDENTIFYFEFFQNYQFEIEISSSGEIINDYGISIQGENVISQTGGKIKFNVSKIVEYFKHRVGCIEFDNKKNINYFIHQLETVLKDFHSVKIDLYEQYSRFNNNGELDKEKIEELKLKYKKLLSEGIYATYYNLDCETLKIDYEYLDEDTLDLTWYISLIYLFYQITDIELTKDEIIKLIPFPEGAFSENDKKMLSLSDIVYIPTIKEQIKRTYSLIETTIFNKLIRNEIQARINDFNSELKYEVDIKKTRNQQEQEKQIGLFRQINKFSEKWLKEFDIGEKLSYGYNEETDTFFIKIDDKYLPEYGFGYSQILYVIFALHNESEKKYVDSTYAFPKTYIIEELETGLHPSFQSKMAEMIVDAHKEFDINFIIETHSEYFIRKIQYLTANKSISTDSTVIYYFNNPKDIETDEEQVKEIFIDKYGGLSDDFGKGFIDEATTLKFDLLRLNKSHQN